MRRHCTSSSSNKDTAVHIDISSSKINLRNIYLAGRLCIEGMLAEEFRKVLCNLKANGRISDRLKPNNETILQDIQ